MTDLAGLMTITEGLWASQTLAVAVRLGLFTQLAEGGASVSELGSRLGLAERPAEILTTACLALGLLTRRDGVLRNSATAEEYLVEGKPYYFGGYVTMLEEYDYPAWMRVAEAVRTDRPTAWDSGRQRSLFDAADPAALTPFWDGMYSLSALTARRLAEVFDFTAVSRLLDVGGGGAAYDIELCRRYPRLRATVYDLAYVCDLTAKRIDEAGLASRIALCPGDFFGEPELPRGHDLMLLSMVMHCWDETRNREIIGKCFRALPPGGQLLISELLVDDDKSGPPGPALMSMAMLVGNWGRGYTAAEYTAWLTAAGFTDVRTIRFDAPGANGVVAARRP
ncbi:SAM-dependent methyltransferase [Acrocarpospora corrugata]|uniref:SAM-dependent methyltransferase n=1 Tax=Acrocarpospora corrugata TaxID=35763 RepID=A0A5M3VYZ4_9ACTN|nr:methyltransferase [Acrocarpospora corrugata]GES01654.1 SAM-dependent methyltransferase [Acrocarpospora corrugata]